MPHVIQAGLDAASLCAFDVFALPTAVEIARIQRGVAVPADLADAYRYAIDGLPSVVAQQARHQWGEVFARASAAAVAVSKGHADLAEAINALDPDTLGDFLRKLE